MALINCPECSKEISDKAVSCPGCGFGVADNVNNQLVQEQVTDEKTTLTQSKKNSRMIITAVVALLLVAFGGIYFFISSNDRLELSDLSFTSTLLEQTISLETSRRDIESVLGKPRYEDSYELSDGTTGLIASYSADGFDRIYICYENGLVADIMLSKPTYGESGNIDYRWQTSKGLRIGDNLTKTITLYGNNGFSKVDEDYYVYYFELKGNKLSKINVSFENSNGEITDESYDAAIDSIRGRLAYELYIYTENSEITTIGFGKHN